MTVRLFVMNEFRPASDEAEAWQRWEQGARCPYCVRKRAGVWCSICDCGLAPVVAYYEYRRVTRRLRWWLHPGINEQAIHEGPFPELIGVKR